MPEPSTSRHAKRQRFDKDQMTDYELLTQLCLDFHLRNLRDYNADDPASVNFSKLMSSLLSLPSLSSSSSSILILVKVVH
jgi:hypothetical protein